MRKRDNAIAMLRNGGVLFMGLAAAIGAIGVGVLATRFAGDAPEILTMAGISLVVGAGSYAMARSFGPSTAPGQLTPEVIRVRIRRMMYRQLILVVQVVLLVVFFVILSQITANRSN